MSGFVYLIPDNLDPNSQASKNSFSGPAAGSSNSSSAAPAQQQQANGSETENNKTKQSENGKENGSASSSKPENAEGGAGGGIGSFFTRTFVNLLLSIVGAIFLVLLLALTESPFLEPSVTGLNPVMCRIVLGSTSSARMDRMFEVFIIGFILFFTLASYLN